MNSILNYDAVAYTDGACRIDVGVGGWGVQVITDDGVEEYCGGEYCTDANRMELKAAIVALDKIPACSRVALYSDSSYVVDSVLSWSPTWNRDWELADRVPRSHSDLWHDLRKLINKHKVSWRWIKGHSSNQGNKRADILATRGMEEYIEDIEYGRMPDF